MDTSSTTSDEKATEARPASVSTPPSDPAAVAERQRQKLLLFAIVGVAFVLRVAAWAHFGTGTIESEGAEYAKIAQNLRNGTGFVGLVSAGPQVLFPPLYPVLIAALSYVTNDCELAGRLISLVLGSLQPVATFGIASMLFNRRIGLISAALSALHPLAIYLSFMVYSEGPYATILLGGIYATLRAFRNPSWRAWILSGAVFGAGYLLRPEGFAACLITVMFAFFASAGDRFQGAKRAALVAAAVFVFALPEVAFLRKTTGKLLLETKSTVLFSYTGGRMLAADKKPDVDYDSAGLSDVPSAEPDVEGGYPVRWQEKWAIYGINASAQETGMGMRPFADVARHAKLPLKDKLVLFKKGISVNGPVLFQRLTSSWIGPLLPLLAFFGAFRRPWRAPRAFRRLYVVAITGAPLLATFFVLWSDDRYYFIFVPLSCLWAGNGVWEMAGWFEKTGAGAGWRFLSRIAPSQSVGTALLVAVMVIQPARSVAGEYEFTDSGSFHRVEREVGQWIARRQTSPIRVMDTTLPLSYHAGATKHVYFPYCAGDVALRYLDAAEVDYIVMRRGQKLTKYYQDWLENGIPDRRAEPLALPSIPGVEQFIVYRWHRGETANR